MTTSPPTASSTTESGDIRHLSTVLVANRGEIGRRIFRTARQMGMLCVAIYTDADRKAPFIGDADQAVRLEGSYLDATAIIEAAKQTGADCVHPGYGFLSENADFARAVVEAGLAWIGPSPDVIATMGDKIQAKRAAVAAGVPILASSEDPADATEVGFPLLVKASAGGGGKGMRVVDSLVDLKEAVASARREAAGAFGDDRVFLERYVPRSRHIEIQILGDGHGNLVHLGERECSIQRRHQKIIEEAPSPRIDSRRRQEMGEAAIALARSIGYESAGTVEFLVDDETGEFFFLEVNTRLQVEHPVTEAITGIDLVRQQIQVAAGQRLAFDQKDVTWAGHAVEARLYAEDPLNDFLPATGTVEAFRPAQLPSVRWDSGIEQGSTVGVDFDPMLAKVIAHGPNRAEATARLVRALQTVHLGGLVTNRDFLVATLASDAFAAGDTTTDFIDRHQPMPRVDGPDRHLAAIVGAIWLQGRHRADDGLWGFAPSNWRNAGLPPERVTFRPSASEEAVTVSYRTNRDGRFSIGSGETVTVLDWNDRGLEVEIDRLRVRALVTPGEQTLHVQLPRTTVTLEVVPRFVVPGSELPTGGLVAPMPGVVTDIRCSVGDTVETGQVLIVLEAMKMEHHIRAPIDGLVTAVPITVGEQLDNGALLVTIEQEPADGEAPAEGAP